MEAKIEFLNLYLTSQGSFEQFHKSCDEKGPTLVFFQLENSVFRYRIIDCYR